MRREHDFDRGELAGVGQGVHRRCRACGIADNRPEAQDECRPEPPRQPVKVDYEPIP